MITVQVHSRDLSKALGHCGWLTVQSIFSALQRLLGSLHSHFWKFLCHNIDQNFCYNKDHLFSSSGYFPKDIVQAEILTSESALSVFIFWTLSRVNGHHVFNLSKMLTSSTLRKLKRRLLKYFPESELLFLIQKRICRAPVFWSRWWLSTIYFGSLHLKEYITSFS